MESCSHRPLSLLTPSLLEKRDDEGWDEPQYSALSSTAQARLYRIGRIWWQRRIPSKAVWSLREVAVVIYHQAYTIISSPTALRLRARSISHEQCFFGNLMTRTLPSSSSRLAPPPVLTWLNSSSFPALATNVAVSPPPTMTVDPFLTALMQASSSESDPLAKAGNSKTPAGPFQRIVLASATVFANISFDLGPQSRPCQSGGIPVSSVASPVW